MFKNVHRVISEKNLTGTSLKLKLANKNLNDKTISIKFFFVTNHIPSLTLTLICKC